MQMGRAVEASADYLVASVDTQPGWQRPLPARTSA